MSSKRRGGLQTKVDGEKAWLVLTESTKDDNGDWTHECGADIMGSTVYLSHRLPKHSGMSLAGSGKVHQLPAPYCPGCEIKPERGVFYDSGEYHIH